MKFADQPDFHFYYARRPQDTWQLKFILVNRKNASVFWNFFSVLNTLFNI